MSNAPCRRHPTRSVSTGSAEAYAKRGSRQCDSGQGVSPRCSCSAPRRQRRDKSKPVTFDIVREIARTLPGAEESTSYGTPAFKVKGKLFARQHQDGESLVVGVDFEEREEMMNAAPEKFYITDHYLNYPWMLVRLSKVRPDELRDLLIGSWRRAAPKRLVVGSYNLESK